MRIHTRKFATPALLGMALLTLVTSAYIDLSTPDNYAGQTVPNYITKDNTPVNNAITNKGATLGRVLFYDKLLSANNSVACASCHHQQFAFGDTAVLSKGFAGGATGRHSMRLVNARFATEQRFFWDERAASLEIQTTKPIQDVVEMGWSGSNGQGNLDSLINKMKAISYYKVLFPWVFGDSVITETRIQFALAQFVRSIQSFDSKFDQGLALTNNINVMFPNYTMQENTGKQLFLTPPPAGGAGCQGCHRAPEFDIDPATKNNGVVLVAGTTNSLDVLNTRAPSLRNLFNANGVLNTPLMHNGVFKTIDGVLNHYNNVPQNPANTNLDPRLQGPGGQLNLTQAQKDAIAAFLRTLTGTSIYTDAKWSDPFSSTGVLSLSTDVREIASVSTLALRCYPNPVVDRLKFELAPGSYLIRVYDGQGRLVSTAALPEDHVLDVTRLAQGLYFVEVVDEQRHLSATVRIVKN